MELSNAHSTAFHVKRQFMSANIQQQKVSKHNLHSNMSYRLSTVNASTACAYNTAMFSHNFTAATTCSQAVPASSFWSLEAVFACCKWSKTGDGNFLGIRLIATVQCCFSSSWEFRHHSLGMRSRQDWKLYCVLINDIPVVVFARVRGLASVLVK